LLNPTFLVTINIRHPGFFPEAKIARTGERSFFYQFRLKNPVTAEWPTQSDERQRLAIFLPAESSQAC
jgi:hypothetical protein